MKPKKNSKIKNTKPHKNNTDIDPQHQKKMGHYHTQQKETRKNYKNIQVHKNKKKHL
jgi:hypothetical protein